MLLGRFVPIVRAVITAVAGVGAMPAGRFLAWSTLGGIVWAGGVTVAGYLLGGITLVRDHVEVMLVAIVVVSLVPVAIEALRARNRGARQPR